MRQRNSGKSEEVHAVQRIDLRGYKKDLRDFYKNIRKTMPLEEKTKADAQIARRFCSLYQYKRAKTLLCYVSTPIEVDTLGIIRQAWQDGKQVAVPRCVDDTRRMEFFLIRSMEDLERRTFGVLEPVPERCRQLRDFRKSICIVPALAYDQDGFRLGYGGGYYDRFLSSYPGVKVGIVYHSCIRSRLPRGRFDVPVHLIVTQRYLRSVSQKPCSGSRPGPKPDAPAAKHLENRERKK